MTNIRNTKFFTHRFVEEFCGNGFGRMSKRDVEILVFYLLIQDGRYKMPGEIYKASRELKLTETKVRNLYQEVQIRYNQYSEQEAKRRLIDLVENGFFERNGDKIVFVVQEPLLRQYFEEWVMKNNGFTDTSFNKNIVVLNVKILKKVIAYLAEDFSKIHGKFTGELEFLQKANDKESLLQIFVEEFVKSAGKESGALAVGTIASGLKALIF